MPSVGGDGQGNEAKRMSRVRAHDLTRSRIPALDYPVGRNRYYRVVFRSPTNVPYCIGMRFHREEVRVRKKGSRERSRAPYVQHRRSHSHRPGSIARLRFPQIFTLALVYGPLLMSYASKAQISAIECEKNSSNTRRSRTLLSAYAERRLKPISCS